MVGSHVDLAPRPTHYWIWARRMARDLLGRTPVPGRDYALTEVVHCGSGDERGVGEALDTCSGRYLKRVISLSPAKLLVLVGDKALFASEQHLAVRLMRRIWGPNDLLGQRRWVLSLPHPGSHKPWGLENYVRADTLAQFQEDLRGTVPRTHHS
jgi:uracil-DNA glycosylase